MWILTTSQFHSLHKPQEESRPLSFDSIAFDEGDQYSHSNELSTMLRYDRRPSFFQA